MEHKAESSFGADTWGWESLGQDSEVGGELVSTMGNSDRIGAILQDVQQGAQWI